MRKNKNIESNFKMGISHIKKKKRKKYKAYNKISHHEQEPANFQKNNRFSKPRNAGNRIIYKIL